MPREHPRHHRFKAEKLDPGYDPEYLFKPGTHNATFLAKCGVLFASHRGEALTRLQRLALDRFHHEDIFNLTLYHPTLNVLTAYFQLFDELFFFGSIQRRVKLSLETTHPSTVTLGFHSRCVEISRRGSQRSTGFIGKLLGRDRSDDYDDDDREGSRCFKVEIFDRAAEFPDLRPLELLSYISTLAHALIHVYLGVYACGYAPCAQDWAHQGVSGHGRAWQAMAHAIEGAMNDQGVLNLEVGLQRGLGLAWELVREGKGERGKVVLGSEDLREWGLGEEEVRREFERLEKWVEGGGRVGEVML